MADTRRLPGPNADVWDWQLDGSCRGMDSAFFFHPDGERGPARAPARGQGEGHLPDLPRAGVVPAARAGRTRAVRHLGRLVGVRTRRHHQR